MFYSHDDYFELEGEEWSYFPKTRKHPEARMKVKPGCKDALARDVLGIDKAPVAAVPIMAFSFQLHPVAPFAFLVLFLVLLFFLRRKSEIRNCYYVSYSILYENGLLDRAARIPSEEVEGIRKSFFVCLFFSVFFGGAIYLKFGFSWELIFPGVILLGAIFSLFLLVVRFMRSKK